MFALASQTTIAPIAAPLRARKAPKTALRRAAAARPHARSLSAEASITIEFPGAYTAYLSEEPAAAAETTKAELLEYFKTCLLYTSPSPRD